MLFQYSLPYLRQTKGCLIQDSSLVAEIGQPGACAYVSTKVTKIHSPKMKTLHVYNGINYTWMK